MSKRDDPSPLIEPRAGRAHAPRHEMPFVSATRPQFNRVRFKELV